MKEHRVINFILGAKKIISVNALYGAKLSYAGGRPIATMYKRAEAKQMEKYIEEQVKLLDIPKNYPWVTKDTKFNLNFTVIFKNGFYLRDVDNCAKNLIDGIFRALEINDSHIISLVAHKKLMPGISEEKILVSLEEADDSCVRYDIIQKPHIIWSKDNFLELRDLPKRGAAKDALFYSADKEKADTVLWTLGKDNFTPSITTSIAMEAYEVMMTGNGFLFTAVDDECWEDAPISEWLGVLREMNAKCGRIIVCKRSEVLDKLNGN